MGCWSRAIWACNKTALPSLAALTLAVGTGGAPVGLLQPYQGITGSLGVSILGRPMFQSEHCKALGTSGDIVLLDPGLYVLGNRSNVTVEVSGHHRFAQDQTALRIKTRFDGRSALTSTLTPENGDTCGWLVVVEDR